MLYSNSSKYVLYCSAMEFILLQLMPVGNACIVTCCIYKTIYCQRGASSHQSVFLLWRKIAENVLILTVDKTHTYTHTQTHSHADTHTSPDFKMVIIVNFEIRGNEGETLLGKLLF